MNHPPPKRLERFMRGDLPRDEARPLVRHLLTGCPRCAYFTSRLWGFGKERTRREEPVVTDAEAFARIQMKEVERELQRIRYRMLGVKATLPPAPVDQDPADVQELDALSHLHAVISCVLQDSIEPAIHDLRELTLSAPAGER